MKIAMFTNTYLPHVGGVARSVSCFAEAYRKLGHECLVIAPEFEEEIPDEKHVYRVPAVTNFNDSGFSFRIPFAGDVGKALDEFEPDIIHAHHPFLLGDTALRSAYSRDLPIVFTHHTLYEEYTNYLPFDSDFTKKAAAEIATGFANGTSMVFAPSGSVADLIKERGVESPVVVQPTGIAVQSFASGQGDRFRSKHEIPADAMVIGHVGRIAKEKNLAYLAEACCTAVTDLENAYFVLVGSGEEEDEIHSIIEKNGLSERFLATGSLSGDDLYDAYASFDIFAFASQSETQGLVLAEAMAGGAPVVALDAPGVRDVMTDGENGIMLKAEATPDEFAAATVSVLTESEKLEKLRKGASETAEAFSEMNMARSAIEAYEKAINSHTGWIEETGIENFDKIIANIEGELQLLKVKASTISAALD
ncbi:glycosyltransferase [Pelagicoccus albus]|uniref:Glycosyltransferase n=1 Tax=Pelagicoccus albus TaxID=415222 RepID=A0A7X1EBQ8_9BACT|nr:glycosyltransferase [Pelagicoccus albus]MBC2608062.1 glycosyltransferase [Pelagicoccus albus]